jgi:hypothetical protein
VPKDSDANGAAEKDRPIRGNDAGFRLPIGVPNASPEPDRLAHSPMLVVVGQDQQFIRVTFVCLWAPARQVFASQFGYLRSQ